MSVCLSVMKIQNFQSWWGWSKRVLEGPGESGRVWKGLERVLGGSLEGHGFQASLKKVGHPGTRYQFWGVNLLESKNDFS